MSNPADAEAHDMWLAERPPADPAADMDDEATTFDAAAWRRANGVAEPGDPWGGDAA